MKYLLAIAFLLSCGGNETDREYIRDPVPSPAPTPTQPAPGGPKLYGEIKAVLQESCGGAACHSGASFLQSEASLRSNTQARNRINSGSMPPSFSPNYALWSDGTRKRDVLEFLNTN